MTTHICRPWKDRRTPQEKQEDELLAAFRQMVPTEQYKLVRRAKMRRGWRISANR